MSRLLTMFAAAFLAMASPAMGAMELTCSSPLMLNHIVITGSTIPFFNEIAKRTNGEVHFTYFGPGTLVATSELLNATLKGVVNTTIMPLSSAPAMFPLASALDLPVMFGSSRESTLAMLTLLEKNPRFQKEFEAWQVLSITASAPRQIASVRKPIKTLEDLKGMKVAAPTPQAGEVLAALGAIPVVMPNNDVYLAIQRGMVDASYMPVPFMKATKITEVAKHITLVDLDFGINGFLMSRKGFDALPENVRNEISRLSPGPFSIKSSFFMDYVTETELDWLRQHHKVNVYTLSPEEKTRWNDAMKPVHTQWVERMRKQGVEDPEGLLNEVRQALKDVPDPKAESLRQLEAAREVLGSLYPTDDMVNVR